MSSANNTSLEHYEVWFLTGSQHLYGEDVLKQVAAQSQEIAAALNESSEVPVKLVWKPVLTDSDAIRRTALEANSNDSVIGVTAWMHTFSPAKMWIQGLDLLRKPLLHLHTQANVELPWADIDFDFMNLNQAAHGDREFGYIQSRLGVPRKTVVGHVSNPEVARQVGVWQRASAGWAAVRNLKLTRFGDNMRNVAVTEGDKTEAELRFGVSVNTWSVNELADAVHGAAESDVDALVADYERLYEVVPELKVGGARHESLRYSARIELGLRSFLEANGSAAFTTSFEDLGELRQLPGMAVQRLMADGYGFGAEGDWKTAILIRAAKVMGAGLPGGASLMEDYTYHLVPGQERILGAHMLEVCPSLTATRPRVEIHPLGIGGKEDPVRMVFDTDAGPGVVVALSDMRDRFRLVANAVDVVDLDEPLPNLPVARALWEPKPDFATSAAAWLTAGAAHHTVLSTQVGVDVFEDFAEIAQTELLTIDEGTTSSSSRRNWPGTPPTTGWPAGCDRVRNSGGGVHRRRHGTGRCPARAAPPGTGPHRSVPGGRAHPRLPRHRRGALAQPDRRRPVHVRRAASTRCRSTSQSAAVPCTAWCSPWTGPWSRRTSRRWRFPAPPVRRRATRIRCASASNTDCPGTDCTAG
jgi:L-arabinose isomerase